MSHKGLIAVLLTGSAAIAAPSTAHAQAATTGTSAGTVITNTAKADYTVNGTPRSTTSNEAKFTVDRKVNLTVVAAQTGNTVVNLGQQDAVTTFTVTNKTNGIQDILLDPDQNVGVGGGEVDNFDVTSLRVFVDANNNGTYEANIDTATYIDELAPDASKTVFIVGNVPDTAGQRYASVSLHATVAAGGATGTKGAALLPTDLNIINQLNEIDVVFADDDSDGALGADAARNGQGRAYLEYEVSVTNVDLAVVKSATVLSDGVNLINPKALPGARVQYCITVTNNTLLTPASGVSLTDTIPANTTYVAGSIKAGGLGTGGVCLLNGFTVNDDGSPTPLSPYSGSFDAATKKVTATTPTLLGGASFAVSFEVTVN